MINKYAIIIYLLCAAACAGVGIYLCCTKEFTRGIIFIIVGVACAGWALFNYFKHRKDDKDDKDKK